LDDASNETIVRKAGSSLRARRAPAILSPLANSAAEPQSRRTYASSSGVSITLTGLTIAPALSAP
jgi:hypothetical protein